MRVCVVVAVIVMVVVSGACVWFQSEARVWSNSPEDKTLLCKFWLKNRCQRSNCNFAHSEERFDPVSAVGTRSTTTACCSAPCFFVKGNTATNK